MFVADRRWTPSRKARARGAVRAAALLLVLTAAGCTTTQARLAPRPVSRIACPARVYVADGAGNFQIASRTLQAVVQADHYPLQTVPFDWSHGYGRVIADQVGYLHARAEGKRLANEVCAFHAAHPEVPVYLLGHSAGCAVVLAALENLSPGMVDRAILLSPALSTTYDLRPALATVQRGVYVFYSQHDYWYLGLITGVLGTSDRRWTASSGRYGFEVPAQCGDGHWYGKLFQRAWMPPDAELGNYGGHYGNYQPNFLRSYIIPLLQPASPPPFRL